VKYTLALTLTAIALVGTPELWGKKKLARLYLDPHCITKIDLVPATCTALSPTGTSVCKGVVVQNDMQCLAKSTTSVTPPTATLPKKVLTTQ